jgi:hypothetical protein
MDRNATDLVVQAAFGAIVHAPSPEEAAGRIEVLAGSTQVAVAPDGSFRALPGTTLRVRLGQDETVVRPLAASQGRGG